MKAISIRQPHAEAIMRGLKTAEFRLRPTSLRGRIYIYASVGGFTPREEARILAEYGMDDLTGDGLPRGMVLGSVELWDCTATERGFHWHLRNPERVIRPATVHLPKAFSVRDPHEFLAFQHLMTRLNPGLVVAQVATGAHRDGGEVVCWGIVYLDRRQPSKSDVEQALKEAGWQPPKLPTEQL